MDENHPMLNRTWVAGDKIDNTLAEHLDADMLQTEQSFIQTYHSQQYRLPGEPPGAQPPGAFDGVRGWKG